MKEGIPTQKVEVGTGEDIRHIEVYEWLTQDEESEYNSILVGDMEVGEKELEAGEFKVKINSVSNSTKFLIESMCKDLKWEEYNNWRPSWRNQLVTRVVKIREESQKK